MCVCSAVCPVTCASRLEAYGGVCSVKGSLKCGYIVIPVGNLITTLTEDARYEQPKIPFTVFVQ